MTYTCGLVVGKAFTNLVINQGINCECPMNYFGNVSTMNKNPRMDLQSFTQPKQHYIFILTNENRLL
jgi:hypothetical protein